MRTVARQNVTSKLLITPYKSIEKHLFIKIVQQFT
jgi:hypothetical protein